jgi:chlorite dismutase
LSPEEQIAAKTQMSELVQEIQAQEAVQLQVFGMVSPKADIGFILTGPDIHGVHALEKRLSLALGPDILAPAYSFLSLLRGDAAVALAQGTLEAGDIMVFFPVGASPPAGGAEAYRAGGAEAYRAAGAEADRPGSALSAAVVRDTAAFRDALLNSNACLPGGVLWVSEARGLEDADWGVTLFCESMTEISRVAHLLRGNSEGSPRFEMGESYLGLTLPLDALFRRVQI